ncbi:RagB/SusD family nutrient uptake outer membrane protein [Saccharicrinis sp. FJH62]|uniref:RagB/SusD family nutrient uptake outer membrane protein n=1 Tax=Saccharicrinis sp. FJH62 TaxID=3344657 RepID=UPI0035D50B00
MKNIVLILLVAFVLLPGCTEYLDRAPESTGLLEDDVFKSYLTFKKFEDQMYKDMHDYLANYDYSFIGAVCDEGYMDCDWETLPKVQNGDWLSGYGLAQALQFTTIWNGWQSIRIANIALNRMGDLQDATVEQKQLLKGQAYFMRAWYYYEFLKRQGGMPYLQKALYGSDNYALPRLTYDETAHMIAMDCDSAMALLPATWDDANIGRPTRGAAMALKASTFIFNASPTNNPDNTTSKWEEAAKAAWDLIQFAESTGTYKLVQCNSTDEITYKAVQNLNPDDSIRAIEFVGGYDSIFHYTPTNDEIIWEDFGQMQNSDRYLTFTTPSLGVISIIQGYSPSQNLIDLYETKNGLSISDDTSFDEQNPYVSRDPRFYHSILFNQERWSSKSGYYLELFEGGTERQSSKKHYSKTGYLARKFWVNNIDQFSNEVHPITHCIYFRYAEVLMWYAEAANELGGPNYTLPGANLTAAQAVNKVRARVKMPAVNAMYLADKNTFRERIKNERAIEFFLEGKRFFDLSRWGDASKIENKTVYGIDLVKDLQTETGYRFNRSSDPVFTYTFSSKHYRWPIPLGDATMFKEFKQNPGW